VNTANINVTTLVAGLLFMALGTMFLLDAADVLSVHPFVIGPLVMIGLGLAIIFGSLADRTA
jgi:hypothetical protein